MAFISVLNSDLKALGSGYKKGNGPGGGHLPGSFCGAGTNGFGCPPEKVLEKVIPKVGDNYVRTLKPRKIRKSPTGPGVFE